MSSFATRCPHGHACVRYRPAKNAYYCVSCQRAGRECVFPEEEMQRYEENQSGEIFDMGKRWTPDY